MFSDFRMHVIGVPQVAPAFGVGKGNVIIDGPGWNEDFRLEPITGNPADRYKFPSSPLSNAALQPAFFHNGAFTRLEDAIQHHLDVARSLRDYDPVTAELDNDLTLPIGPLAPMLARLDPLLVTPLEPQSEEFHDLVAFVRESLLDGWTARKTCANLPRSVPSGFSVLQFERCQAREPDSD